MRYSFWLIERSWSTERRGDSSPFLFIRVFMADKILSIFIDESGDFGPYEKHNPYYLVAMVAHDQSVDISEEINKMDNYMVQNGREVHAIHVGPLIRREAIYLNEFVEDRKHIFNLLYNFVRRTNIKYLTCMVKKVNVMMQLS